MARSRINNTTDDLITDGGAVLWSFVKGEQLELPIKLDFIADATIGYSYEAVVMEAANIEGQQQTQRPISVQSNGVEDTLVVRVPTYRGTWDPPQAYNKEEVVLYNGTYYKLLNGAARINSTAPNLDPLWEETALNRIYVQFPETLANNWAVNPLVNSPVYGFFELRVTEPANPVFVKTWKPVRGMVEILFSPTHLVP